MAMYKMRDLIMINVYAPSESVRHTGISFCAIFSYYLFYSCDCKISAKPRYINLEKIKSIAFQFSPSFSTYIGDCLILLGCRSVIDGTLRLL
jgi:hypothetical protein